MSETLGETITMPDTIHMEAVSDGCHSPVPEDSKSQSPNLEKATKNIGRSADSPSSEGATQRSSLTTAEATETVFPNSPTPQTDSSLQPEPDTTKPLQGKKKTQSDPESHSPTSTTLNLGVEPENPTPLPEEPVPQAEPEMLKTTPVSPPPRRVSFPVEPSTQVFLSPSGPEKEPSKELKGGLQLVHRMSSISIPGSIGDTPATSFSALVKLWVVVILTLVLCAGLMVSGHLTHSLTLRVEAYHALYNAGALAGSLLSIKLCRQPESLQNTFGWARVDVVSYLISLIFLSSLCFSVVVEAIQTAAHVQHQDSMHYPMATILIAVAALGVNALVFALIGGYTQHQGSFMEVRVSGDVFMKKQVRQDSLQTGQKTLSSRRNSCPGPSTLREGYKDVLRDIAGLLLMVACASVVMQTEGTILSLYIDPAVAVTSVAILAWLSYPFAKECSNILLQTIPEHIDVDRFSERLQESFPGILNVHHLHIWSLRPGKVVSTIHVVFASKDVYGKIRKSLNKFFKKEGISLVTLQPEFMKAGVTNAAKCCCSDHLLDGAGDSCDDHACQTPEDHDHHDHKGHDHNHDHHHHSKNGHSHAHEHKEKPGYEVCDHDHPHMHDRGDNPEPRQIQDARDDFVNTNLTQTLQNGSIEEQAQYESNSDKSTTPDEHSKLHENQVHQHPDAEEVDISVRHERGTTQAPDHSLSCHADTNQEETSANEDRISTSSRISQHSSAESTSEKVVNCNVSHRSDSQMEPDACSVSLDGRQLAEEMRKRSADNELESNGVVACKVDILCEDGTLDCLESETKKSKEVAHFDSSHLSSETSNSTIIDDSSMSNSSWVVVEDRSSMQEDGQHLNDKLHSKEEIASSVENKSFSQVQVVDETSETPAVDCLLNVPKIEITMRELIISDEDGNLLFSDMRYASGCPDVEVTASAYGLRKASSESYLLDNSTETDEVETKPRSDSTLSANESSAMLGSNDQVAKEGSNFDLEALC